MLVALLLMIFGFGILSYGAVCLVDGSSSIAKRFHISHIAIGLTIVAFGTSAPEMLVNVMASFKGVSDMAFGNVLGSNIFNTLMILGVSVLIHKIYVSPKTIKYQMIMLIFGSILVLAFANNFGFTGHKISRLDGFFLVLIMISAYYFLLKDSLREEFASEIHEYTLLKSILLTIAGFIGLYFGAKFVVDNGVKIARILHVSEKLIGLTIVALGTSLPEFVTSIVAVRKKHYDIAIGNVVGSNLFNIFLVLGIGSMVSPMPYSPILNIDFAFLIFITIILSILLYTGKKYVLEKKNSIILIGLYLIYLIYLSIRK